MLSANFARPIDAQVAAQPGEASASKAAGWSQDASWYAAQLRGFRYVFLAEVDGPFTVCVRRFSCFVAAHRSEYSQPLVASLRPRRTPQCDGNVHERVCLYTTDTIVSVASRYILLELWMVDGSALSRCAPTLKAHTCPRPTPMPHAAHDDA